MDGIHPPQDRQQIVISLGIGLFFIAACLIVSIAGPRSRVYSRSQISEVLPDSKSALEVWTRYNIKGRTLLLFDSRLNADSSSGAAVTDENYVDAAITRNLVRRVVHVVPKVRWQEASDYLRSTGLASYSDGRFVTTIDGAPLEVTTLDRLMDIGEKPLLHVNWTSFSPVEAESIEKLISSGSTEADVITMTGRAPLPLPSASGESSRR